MHLATQIFSSPPNELLELTAYSRLNMVLGV